MPKTEGSPAILPDARRARLRASVVGRYVKMLRAICATCQRGPNVAEDWWKTCPHEPYISVGYKTEIKRRYEDLEDGSRKLVGTDTIETPFERPNWVQVPLMNRIGGGRLVQKKQRRYGFIFPEDVRSAEYPYGIYNPCEYRDCFWNVPEDIKTYRWGRFCRPREAQLFGHDQMMDKAGGALEVGDSEYNVGKQARQLDEVPL